MWITLLGLSLSPALAQDDAEVTEEVAEDDALFFSTTGRWKDGEIDPRVLLDNSAYTIDRNQVLISPLSVDWGVLDNVQVGSNLVLDVLEIYNARAKVTAVQQGPLEASFQATYSSYNLAELVDEIKQAQASIVTLDWRASYVVRPRWSLHGGQSWYLAEVTGDFQLGTLGEALARLFGEDLSDDIAQTLNNTTDTTIFGGANINVRRTVLATDFRFNRRDQLIFVWNALTGANGRVDAGVSTDATQLGENASLGLAARFELPVSEVLTNSLTIAYQANWEHFHLRLGFTPPIGGVDSSTALYNTLTEGFQAYWIF